MSKVGQEAVRIGAVPVDGESGDTLRGKPSPATCVNRPFKTYHVHLVFRIH